MYILMMHRRIISYLVHHVIDMSQMFLQFPFAVVCAFAVMMLQAHAQDQSDFISIDCGLQQDKDYKEQRHKITYTADRKFIETGESKPVIQDLDNFQEFRFVRSFPEGIRNCYKIEVENGQKYLMRANFVYGNYDGKDYFPEFELHLGASLWDSVVIDITKMNRIVTKELIHIPVRDYIHICLVDIGKGTPFISTIELRPLHKDAYQTENVSLALLRRGNCQNTGSVYRYPYDVNDRIWYSYFDQMNWKVLNTTTSVDPRIPYQIPSPIMTTAATPKDISIKYLNFSLAPLVNGTYYTYLHFAEVKSINGSLVRSQLNIDINGKRRYDPFYPSGTASATIAVQAGGRLNFSIYSPGTSSETVFLNAFEIYTMKELLVSETDEHDVGEITNIKSTYKIIKNWQGDPCNPQKYRWEGVNCSYSHNDSRIISVNLSSSGLTGSIDGFNLTMIETLDLSNNNLSGVIPKYLSQLEKLKLLNLEKNELTGPVPTELIAKKNKRRLSLRLDGNPHLSFNKKKNQFVIPVVVIVIVMSWVASAAVILKKSKKFHAVWDYWRVDKGVCTESKIEQNTREHDVFLSFRGPDTRTTFARYLYKALEKKGIKTFFDDEEVKKGDEIAPTLLHAIEASMISIILFSENYVTSSWCLGELAHIVDCKRKNKDRRIIPVFYKVNPTDIRHQSGSFSLKKWIDRGDVKVPVWEKALTEVVSLSGFHYTGGYEPEKIDEIVKYTSDVIERQKKNSLDRFDTICPPDGEDEIVIYMTSSARDMNLFRNCQSMLQSLSQFVLKVQMRDVTSRKFRKELKKLMEKECPPRLFVHGKYVGGYDEVSRLIKEEPWFCEVLNKLQRRDEMSSHSRDLVQQEEAWSVRDSETDSDGHGGSPV